MLGIESWKAALNAVLLPPFPFLLMILAGARLMFHRRLLAWSLVLGGVLAIWFMGTPVVAVSLENALLAPPPPLSGAQIADLRRAPKTAIVVLGAGRIALSPEYGVSNLKPMSIERLRYGEWLARQTQLPLVYSGGVGWGASPGPSEAEIATRIAAQEFDHPLRWSEGESRDTSENAIRSIALLRAQGIGQIVIVTHGFHMRRALGDFERASRLSGTPMKFVEAPMGLIAKGRFEASDWLPSGDAYALTRNVIHEWVGRLAGA